VSDTGFDWTTGPRWTVGRAPATGKLRAAGRPNRRRGIAYLLVAVSAATAMAATLALAGAAASSPTPYTCAGAPPDAPRKMYPEKRYYLETQAWWSPMPGHSPDEPFQDRTGHIHLGACVPLYQTVSGGKLQLDMKWQEHMMQGVNGKGAPLPINFLVNIEGVFEGPNLRRLGLWQAVPCTTMQCEGWVSVDFDYSKAPRGWGNLNPFIQDFFTDCAEGPPNCRQLRTLNHWPVNFVTNNPPAPSTNESVLAPDAYTGGESWFSVEPNFGSHYARTFVQRDEIAKLWNIETGALVPKSGTFHIKIGGQTDGNRAMLDPSMHAMPPVLGKVILDKPPVTGRKAWEYYDLAIDTTKLSDGTHKLAFQNIYKRPSGEQSGLIVLPFLVANSTAAPTSTNTTSTTTTTTTTTPSNTKTTPGHHAKRKLTCAEHRAKHQTRVKALRAMVAKLKKRLAHESAKNDRLRRRIARARKEIAVRTRCP
jgi:hypothetical protein